VDVGEAVVDGDVKNPDAVIPTPTTPALELFLIVPPLVTVPFPSLILPLVVPVTDLVPLGMSTFPPFVPVLVDLPAPFVSEMKSCDLGVFFSIEITLLARGNPFPFRLAVHPLPVNAPPVTAPDRYEMDLARFASTFRSFS
jgi:hypothetical protein